MHIIREIIETSKRFEECHLQYVNGNQVAHKLARHTWKVNKLCVWWDSISDFIRSPVWANANL